MRVWAWAVAIAAGAGAIWSAQSQPVSPGPLDAMETPEPGYTGPLFKPNYAFPPSTAPEPRPWEAIDFVAEPAKYMDALLAYVLEGQTDRWDVASNPIRQWYHMPWMGPGGQGREYISGLTSERRSRKGELGPGQTRCRQNWAVGFYNPVGGSALGKIWAPVNAGTSMKPNLNALPFPAGTVVAKALYTEATPAEVPLLAGAPTIQARIVKDPTPDDDVCPPDAVGGKPAAREAATLHLLQVDVAVRDPDADSKTGWVFGTFVYDGRLPGTDPWKKLRPAGLMWGNDSTLSDESAALGVKPSEGVFLSNFGLQRNFGRGGRMNGPVDNPESACLSCHMTAQFPATASMAPQAGMDWEVAKCWFRDLSATTPFGGAPSATSCGQSVAGQRSLDYSLQLAVGARNIAIAEQNSRRSFFSARLSPDRVVKIDGVESVPISRDEAVSNK